MPSPASLCLLEAWHLLDMGFREYTRVLGPVDAPDLVCRPAEIECSADRQSCYKWKACIKDQQCKLDKVSAVSALHAAALLHMVPVLCTWLGAGACIVFIVPLLDLSLSYAINYRSSEGRNWAQATSDAPDVRVCRPADLKQKLMAPRMEAPDKFGNPINVRDLVDVKQGSYLEGKSGTVKYIWRGKLFLQSK